MQRCRNDWGYNRGGEKMFFVGVVFGTIFGFMLFACVTNSGDE